MNDKPAMANTQAFAVITQDELSSLRAANARLQAWHDAVMGQDDAAHIMPSDLEKFADSETFAQCYSVAVGNPEENSVPLITRPQPLAKE